MWESLKTKAKNLVTKHGAEVGVVAKIAAHALIPGAPIVVGAVESLCDYAADKGQELTDEKMTELLESLGSDVQHLETLLGHLSGQLDGIVGQMSQLAGFGAAPDVLEKMMNSALESQFSTLRGELRGMSARFESVERQNQAIIDHLSVEGDKSDELLSMLRALREEVAELKGVPTDEVERNAVMERLFEAKTLADLEALYSTLSGVGWSKELKQILRVVLFVLKGDHIKAREANRDLTRLGSPRAKTIARSVARVTEMGGPAQSASAESQGPQKLQVGDRLGSRGWTLKAQIGDGGMGSVWRVVNRFNEEAALKVIHAELHTDHLLLQRFQAEIKTLGSISHPAVIEVIDWGEEHGIWYLVMPLIKGKSLASRLRSGHLDLPSTKAIARSIASALVACHAKGIIHRDIKPDNIMLKADGSPVLIDFGIAHQDGVGTGQTQIATAGYAPPEQLAGQPVDGTADLFALGRTLAECLGTKAGEGEWRELIGQLTHFMPSVRGTAQSILDKLSEAPKKYFSSIPGQDPKGPFSTQEVCAQVLAGAKDLHLWWEGESAWQKWDVVAEVKALVGKQRKPTPPPMPAQLTPPPPPPASKPQLKAGDRVESKVGAVSFYERVIPAPPSGKPFMMMETQVTQALYREVTGESPSHFKGDQLPVEQVSWEDGIAFCNALSKKLGLTPAYKGIDNNCELVSGANGFRLPFEAEWVFAAKAGQNFKYSGSDNIDDVAWYGGGLAKLFGGGNVTNNQTQPVAQLKPNGYGLYDMSGNVWEWCADDYNNPGQHRLGASERANRGGSWSSNADRCEVSIRSRSSPGYRDSYLGLRLSRSLG